MLVIGIQSFGGGSATFFLIHQACMKNGWLDEEEFLRNWALSQLSPGINLIKFTVILGNRLRGWPGVVAASAGLLAPSGLVTILMTAFFALFKDEPAVKAAMRGIMPATIGLALVMSSKLGLPVLKRALKEGLPRFGLHLVILAASCYAMISGVVSPAMILLLSGGFAILFLTAVPLPRHEEFFKGSQ
jgi:chromate transporter